MPPFTGSDVTLEKDILRPEVRRDFFPTWFEWASQNFDQIEANGNVTDANAKTIHTVPANKILYITDAYMVIERDTNAGAGHFEFGDHVFIMRIACNKNNNTTLAITFPAPLVVREGETVVIQPQGGFSVGSIRAGFHGFQIDKRIS